MKYLAITILVLIVSSSLCAAAEPEVLVELTRNSIFEGESVLYRVVLNHVENPSPPKLEGFDDFEVQPRGEQSLDSRKISIINGRRSEVVRRGRAYHFVLTPRRTGELTVPAPTAEVDGVTLRGKSLTLRVIAPQEQDLAIVEVRADKTELYPTQAFTLTLTVAVRELSEPFAKEDPVRVLRGKPALSIPWATDDGLPPGVQPNEPWQRWISKYMNRDGRGFNINGLGIASAFSFFGNSPSGFLTSSDRVRHPDLSGKPAGYVQYTLERSFTPMQVGEFSFAPVTLKGALAARVSSTGNADLEEIYAIGKQVSVTGKDAPQEGRPDSYCGAIGRFDWSGQLAPTEAKTGDPMTLTLTLRGKGTLDNVQTPDLTRIPEIAAAFKVYEATEDSSDGQRQFIYGLRPLLQGVTEFPAVPFSYFDADREQYATLATDEVPIRIAKAERLSDQDIEVSESAPSSQGAEIETQEGGIFANDSALTSLRDDSVDPVRWFAGLGSLTGVYVVIVLVHQKMRRLTGDPELVRRRSAAARARRRFAEAASSTRASGEWGDLQQAAIFGLIADAAGIPEAGLTSEDVRARLAQMGMDEQLSDRLSQWCEACDAARYGAGADAGDELNRQAEMLLEDMIGDLKAKKLLS